MPDFIANTLLALLVVFSSAVSAEVSSRDLDALIALYQSGPDEKIKLVTDELGFAGISDERLFDVIEQKVLQNYHKRGRDDADMTGWLMKALSYSGNEKYLKTLRTIDSDRSTPPRVRRYTDGAIETLARYGRWNPVIGANLEGLDDYQTQVQRTKNMLNSSYHDLVMVGVKRVYNLIPDNVELQDIVSAKLQAVADVTRDNQDDVRWMIKALSRSGSDRYREVLEKYSTRSNRFPKVPSEARKALERLDQEIAWNQEINRGVDGLTGTALEVERIKNMLQSDNHEIIREGARRIFFSHRQNKELSDQAEKVVLAIYTRAGDRLFEDTVSWLCKALMSTGNEAYRKTLTLVADNAFEPKIKRSVKNYVEKIDVYQPI